MIEALHSKRNFFVSFNQADRVWATWIAWVLEEKGYSVFFQDWDFKGNFILEMDRAHKLSRRTLAVLSPDYLASRFAPPRVGRPLYRGRDQQVRSADPDPRTALRA